MKLLRRGVAYNTSKTSAIAIRSICLSEERSLVISSNVQGQMFGAQPGCARWTLGNSRSRAPKMVSSHQRYPLAFASALTCDLNCGCRVVAEAVIVVVVAAACLTAWSD